MITSISFAVLPFWSFVHHVCTASGYDDMKDHPTYKAIVAALSVNQDISVSIPMDHIIPTQLFDTSSLLSCVLPDGMVCQGKMFVFADLTHMFYSLLEFYENLIEVSPDISRQVAHEYDMLKRCLTRMEAITEQNDLMDTLADLSF